MKTTSHYLSCAVLACLSGFAMPAHANDNPGLIGKKISFAPMPVEISLQPNEKPAMVVAMPCSMVEKMSFGFPPVAMAETFMFQMVGIMNNTNMMPMRFEPVCS
ncbi:MAG: hypothetical protein ABL892_11070 [Thiobacillaceae bacterium]